MQAATGYVYTMQTVSAPSNAAVQADMQYGSNGSPWGPSEYGVVNRNNDEQDGNTEWDSSGDPSFDSDLVNVSFEASIGGQATLNVGGDSTGPVSVDSDLSSLSSVQIVVGTQEVPGSAIAKGISVQFLDANGNCTSIFSSGSGIAEDNTNTNSQGEQVLNVTPAAGTSAVSVIVNMQVEFTAPASSTPYGTDLFSDVYIF